MYLMPLNYTLKDGLNGKFHAMYILTIKKDIPGEKPKEAKICPAVIAGSI